MTSRTEQPSTAELVERLGAEVSTLVRDELALARVELVEKGKRAGTGAGLLGGAGVVALYGIAALLLTAGAALALVLPAWTAALVVTAVLMIGAGVAAVLGSKQVTRAVPPGPAEAMESGRRDIAAVQTAIRDGRQG